MNLFRKKTDKLLTLKQEVQELNDKYQKLKFKTGIFDMMPMVFRYFTVQNGRIVAVICKNAIDEPNEHNAIVIRHKRSCKVVTILENGIRTYNRYAYGTSDLL